MILTAKFRENWTTRKFPVLRYLSHLKSPGIFNLDLYAIALLKKKFDRVSYDYLQFMEYLKCKSDNKFVLYCSKQKDSPDSVVIRKVPHMAAFVQTENQVLLRDVLKPKYDISGKNTTLKHANLEEANQYTWKYHLREARESLLESNYFVGYSRYSRQIIHHLKTVTMYEQPDVLAEFLKYNPSNQFLLLPCEVLERPKCKEILSQYQDAEETEHLSDTAKTGLLIDLLGIYFDQFQMKY